MLAVSRSGPKLAFCPGSASTVHLYDAASLALLGCVDPFARMRSEVQRPVMVHLDWSVFGWLLLAWQPGGCFDSMYSLHFMKAQESCNIYLKQVLGQIAQPEAGFVFSPDGAFLCSVQQQDSVVLNIHDTRFGSLVAKRAVKPDLKSSLKATNIDVKYKVLGWSRCGHQLLVRMRLHSEHKVWEHVTFILI